MANRQLSFDPPTITIPIFLYLGVGIMEYFIEQGDRRGDEFYLESVINCFYYLI